MTRHQKKPLNHYISPQDNYQIFINRSGNAWYPRYYYYINGQKCNALGQTQQDPGYDSNNLLGQFVPISYNPKQTIPIEPAEPPRSRSKKKLYPGLSNLSSSQNLNLIKWQQQNTILNNSRKRIFNNQPNQWDKKNHYNNIYPPSPKPFPYPSNSYIIPNKKYQLWYA